MYYVYMLRSLKDNNLYIGQSRDPYKRLKLHNSGKVMSTKPRRPFILLGYKEYPTRNEARWVEYNLKNHSDKKHKFLKDLESFNTNTGTG